MRYRVFFHRGDELGLKTRVDKGRAWIDETGLHISGPIEILVSRSDFVSAELFRLHGLGRVIRIEHRQGRLFLSAIRFMIGQFAVINFFTTGRLLKEIVAMTESPSSQISS